MELAYCCQKPLLLAGLRRWVRFVSVGPLGSSTTRTVRPPIVRTTVRTTARTTSATTPPFARRCLGLAPESRFYRLMPKRFDADAQCASTVPFVSTHEILQFRGARYERRSTRSERKRTQGEVIVKYAGLLVWS